MITMIPRSKLEPHPDNPRKDLGDLTELAASIKRSGLLQNLTVVPHPDKPDHYRIIIGHRRFAASELAELDELPCSVEDMNPIEQIATMLAENMQRTDLTIADQVSGVQCMMDLGENTVGMSVKTGLSTTTIRKREKLAKLDFAKLKSAEQRGATLFKLMEIEEIEDPEQRDRALDAIGTPEYNRVMWDIKAENLRKRLSPQMIEAVEKYATRIEKQDINTDIYVDYFGCHDDGLEKAKSFKGKGEFVYTLYDNGSINLYRRKAAEETEAETKKRAAKERIAKRVAEERELRNKFNHLRMEFLKGLNVKSNEQPILRFVLWTMTRWEYQSSPHSGGLLSEIFDATSEQGIAISPTFEDIEKCSCTLRGILFAVYDRAISMDGVDKLIDTYTGKYKENQKANDLYAYMMELGYEPCEEEQQWMNGEHPCFHEEGIT